MIINRAEENETLEYEIGAEIVELLGRACDYLYDKEPELLREVRKVMEPVIKLARDEIEEQKEAEIKEIEKKKDAEIKEIRDEMNEQHIQHKKQLEQFIKTCIHQCKLAGNGKPETQQILQKLLLDESVAREKLEKYW